MEIEASTSKATYIIYEMAGNEKDFIMKID